jgi:hypothetical protein
MVGSVVNDHFIEVHHRGDACPTSFSIIFCLYVICVEQILT